MSVGNIGADPPGERGLGAKPAVARRRRQALRDTLVRIVTLVVECGADALVCAGALYEHDRYTPDTAAFLREMFKSLHPVRVYVSPGNHDWYGPDSLYRHVVWSEEVHVFRADRLEPVALDDGVTLWGAAHCAPANTRGFLDDFHVDRAGVHLALFHGSELGWLAAQGRDKVAHMPFQAEQLARAGLHHAFLGHYHSPRDAPTFTYPGNPDPLTFDGEGPRGAVIATIAQDGRVDRLRHAVAVTTAHDRQVDLTGCASQQEVRARVVDAVRGLSGVARVTLGGEIGRDVDLRPQDLDDVAPGSTRWSCVSVPCPRHAHRRVCRGAHGAGAVRAGRGGRRPAGRRAPAHRPHRPARAGRARRPGGALRCVSRR